MLFSHVNILVTTLFSHHCCNNVLTSWNRRTNNSEHGCSINIIFFLFPTTTNNLFCFIIATIYIVETMLNNIVETRMNNIVETMLNNIIVTWAVTWEVLKNSILHMFLNFRTDKHAQERCKRTKFMPRDRPKNLKNKCFETLQASVSRRSVNVLISVWQKAFNFRSRRISNFHNLPQNSVNFGFRDIYI